MMNVPEMGDSITEGTLLSWEKNPGDPVQMDDVLAVIETDKVSVDVRAQQSGVVKEVFAAIDDTILVGSPLVTIDTEASVDNSQPAASQAQSPPASTVAPVSVAAEAKSHRVPSIQFLGKQGWERRKRGQAGAGEDVSPGGGLRAIIESAAAFPEVKHTAGALDSWALPEGALYGRPPISVDEMDAVESGGATAFD